MMRWNLFIALALAWGMAHAQTPMPVETRVAIGELQALAARQPDAHKLTAELQGR
ncbi:MAG: hypothetical protein JST98_03505, partial [Bacteroidetes bacterium]|nr:hypothetical protein [Bacteroidota bacterium]